MARGRIGTKVQPQPRHAFGDPEEVAQRDKAAYSPQEPHFVQPPAGDREGSFDDMVTTQVGGHFKFDDPFS